MAPGPPILCSFPDACIAAGPDQPVLRGHTTGFEPGQWPCRSRLGLRPTAESRAETQIGQVSAGSRNAVLARRLGRERLAR
jgi:hypothetical protein